MEKKISFIEEDNYKYLVYEAESTAIKNNLAIHMAENNEIPQLLEVYFAENGEMKGEYDISECSSFWEHIPRPAGRDEVFLLLQKLLFTIRALKNYFICEPDILLQKEYIYINNKTSMIQFVAAPEILPEDNSIMWLMKDIMDAVQWREDEKKTYLDNYAQALKENVSCDSLLKVIGQILKEPLEFIQAEPVIPPMPEAAPVSPIPEAAPISPIPPIPPVSTVPPTAPVSAGPIPPVIPSVAIPVPPKSIYQPDFYEDESESSIGETTVLGISSQPMVFPVLIRIKNNEKVVVNKMEFLIGKDPTKVDFCIFDNSAVSRVHAKIISRNGEFFVVDNHSTNHVYVNGMLIDANTEVRLTHGSRVRLGDEDFEFRFQ